MLRQIGKWPLPLTVSFVYERILKSGPESQLRARRLKEVRFPCVAIVVAGDVARLRSRHRAHPHQCHPQNLQDCHPWLSCALPSPILLSAFHRLARALLCPSAPFHTSPRVSETIQSVTRRGRSVRRRCSRWRFASSAWPQRWHRYWGLDGTTCWVVLRKGLCSSDRPYTRPLPPFPPSLIICNLPGW